MDLFGRIWGACRGQQVYVIRNPEHSCATLKSSSKKGQFLEAKFARDGWLPSLSVESEDGDSWKRLRIGFDSILKQVNYREKLPLIITQNCEGMKGIVDAKCITFLVASILIELLFDYKLSLDELEEFWIARNEWAKTLSVKGKPDLDLRSQFFAKIESFIYENENDSVLSFPPRVSKYTKYVRPDGLSDLEWTSCFFQPFIMSPMINVIDIIVTAQKHFSDKSITDSILSLLCFFRITRFIIELCKPVANI